MKQEDQKRSRINSVKQCYFALTLYSMFDFTTKIYRILNRGPRKMLTMKEQILVSLAMTNDGAVWSMFGSHARKARSCL